MLIINIVVTLVLGFLSGYVSNSMNGFMALNTPPLMPPAWVFAVVWPILYILMAVSSFIIWSSNHYKKRKALQWYVAQLIVNLLWPIIFFRLEMRLFAFIWLLLLLFLIYQTMKSFKPISEIACRLLVPYFIWCMFAGYLNLATYLLNR